MFLLKKVIRFLSVQMMIKEYNQLIQSINGISKDLVCKKEEIKLNNIMKQYKNVFVTKEDIN